MAIYTVTMAWGETWRMRADFAQASSPLQVESEESEDGWSSTPYQVADARHRPENAAALVAAWWHSEGGYLGDDYGPEESALGYVSGVAAED